MSTNVDATFIGGDARFINHSCEPNLKLFMYRPNNVSLLGMPYFKALRTILPTEELTFDYGSSDVEESLLGKRKHSLLGLAESQMKKCICGAQHCRGFLPSAYC